MIQTLVRRLAIARKHTRKGVPSSRPRRPFFQLIRFVDARPRSSSSRARSFRRYYPEIKFKRCALRPRDRVDSVVGPLVARACAAGGRTDDGDDAVSRCRSIGASIGASIDRSVSFFPFTIDRDLGFIHSDRCVLRFVDRCIDRRLHRSIGIAAFNRTEGIDRALVSIETVMNRMTRGWEHRP